MILLSSQWWPVLGDDRRGRLRLELEGSDEEMAILPQYNKKEVRILPKGKGRMQMRIFVGDSYRDLERAINAWLAEHEQNVLVRTTQSQYEEFITITIWYR